MKIYEKKNKVKNILNYIFDFILSCIHLHGDFLLDKIHKFSCVVDEYQLSVPLTTTDVLYIERSQEKCLSSISVSRNQRQILRHRQWLSVTKTKFGPSIMVSGKQKKFRSFISITGNRNEIPVVDNVYW